MMGSGMMGLSLVWVLVLLVGLIALVIWIVKVMFPQNGHERTVPERESDRDFQREESALEIARQRYARGEISREEFSRLKEDLT